MSSKKLSGRQLQKFRSDVAKLKAKGLVSKRVDARSQKPTRYMRSQVKRFDEVLSGKAQVVHVPKRAAAKEFGARFDTKGRSIIVPNTKGEKLRYAPKRKEIVSSATRNGAHIQKVYSSKPVKNARDLPVGPGIRYTIRLGREGSAGVFSFNTIEDLELFLRDLANSGFTKAINYVEVTRGHKVIPQEPSDEEDGED